MLLSYHRSSFRKWKQVTFENCKVILKSKISTIKKKKGKEENKGKGRRKEAEVSRSSFPRETASSAVRTDPTLRAPATWIPAFKARIRNQLLLVLPLPAYFHFPPCPLLPVVSFFLCTLPAHVPPSPSHDQLRCGLPLPRVCVLCLSSVSVSRVIRWRGSFLPIVLRTLHRCTYVWRSLKRCNTVSPSARNFCRVTFWVRWNRCSFFFFSFILLSISRDSFFSVSQWSLSGRWLKFRETILFNFTAIFEWSMDKISRDNFFQFHSDLRIVKGR